METIVLLIVILVLAVLLALVLWLWLQAKNEPQLMRDSQQNELQQYQAELHQQQIENTRLATELEQRSLVSHEQEQKLQQLQIDFEASKARYAELKTSLELAEQEKEKDREHLEEKICLLESSKEQLKKEFSQLATEIFEERQKQFKATNKEQISDLLKPFGDDLQKFHKRVNDIHDKQTEGTASLKQELKQLKELNQQITDEAANLTKALKGESKTQGNWGEMQVELILEQSGLRKGEAYLREPNFKDDENKNWRPDFIVNLPEGKHIIIDSKVSLTAYSNFVAEEDEELKEKLLKEHIASVKKHISDLGGKDYSSLNGLQAPDFVLMFMPVEPAFNLAFSMDANLFNEAFKKNIVVVTPTTLLATLKTVANIWSVEKQNRNARKIADEASKIYDRLRVFVTKMDTLGQRLGSASKSYDDAMTTLSEGRGNVIRRVEQFRELGVRVKEELPASVLDGNRAEEAEDGFAELADSDVPTDDID